MCRDDILSAVCELMGLPQPGREPTTCACAPCSLHRNRSAALKKLLAAVEDTIDQLDQLDHQEEIRMQIIHASEDAAWAQAKAACERVVDEDDEDDEDDAELLMYLPAFVTRVDQQEKDEQDEPDEHDMDSHSLATTVTPQKSEATTTTPPEESETGTTEDQGEATTTTPPEESETGTTEDQAEQTPVKSHLTRYKRKLEDTPTPQVSIPHHTRFADCKARAMRKAFAKSTLAEGSKVRTEPLKKFTGATGSAPRILYGTTPAERRDASYTVSLFNQMQRELALNPPNPMTYGCEYCLARMHTANARDEHLAFHLQFA
jgi:hypothetical protein